MKKLPAEFSAGSFCFGGETVKITKNLDKIHQKVVRCR